jgi:hypothetical protein
MMGGVPYRMSALEGALAGGVVGVAGAVVLTGDTITVEVGQFLWLTMILAAGAVIAGPPKQPPLSIIRASLPFMAAVTAVLLWTGAAFMAYHVGRAVMIAGIRLPLAAYTEREMAIRYGLFYLFVLAASPPAVLTAVPMWKGVARGARLIAGWPLWRTEVETWTRTTLLRVFRILVSAAMLGLTRLV